MRGERWERGIDRYVEREIHLQWLDTRFSSHGPHDGFRQLMIQPDSCKDNGVVISLSLSLLLVPVSLSLSLVPLSFSLYRVCGAFCLSISLTFEAF